MITGHVKTIRISTIALKDYFDRKLNLPCRCRGLGQQARCRVRCPRAVENISVDSLNRRREIRMIENIENLGAELEVEPLRDPSDVVVLEQRKVQRRDTRADQDVPPRIAAKIEALRKRSQDWRLEWWPWSRLGIRGRCVAVCRPGIHIARPGRDNETIGLDVVDRIPRVRERTAPGSTQPVRERPIVAAERALGVRSGSPGRGEWNAAAGREYQSQFPSAQCPLGRRGERLRRS